jgi:formate-dependent phosphoribosylglycinamide formyltransferase (GAR transformylase)
VEEYIEARQEVSVEVICHEDTQRVIAVTDKYLGDEPYFVETGHSVPSVYQDNLTVRSVAEKACAALGIRYGIAHVEMRVMPSGEVRIIEVGARTGGDCIMDLVSRAFGVNPYYLHVQSYLGITPSLPERLEPKGLAAVAFLKADTGVIRSVSSPKALPESVVNLQVTAKPLDTSHAPISWKFREGSVELFWPAKKPEPGYQGHLQIAKELSQNLFQVARG